MFDIKTFLPRGGTIQCNDCPKNILILHTGQLPQGWLIKTWQQEGVDKVHVLCPKCDDKNTWR